MRTGISAVSAFTLIELLVVIAIMGILAAVALPRLGSFGKSNATIAASQQLLDDIASARARAIASRSDVYMVFVPSAQVLRAQVSSFPENLVTFDERNLATNLLQGQYTTYALYSEHSVGDQPGQRNPRYLTSWKSLPQGTFIGVDKFDTSAFNYEVRRYSSDGILAFDTNAFPFPLSTSGRLLLPYIAFDYQGKVLHYNDGAGIDEILPLARGSIFYEKNANGQLLPPYNADVLENPPFNSRKNHQFSDGTTNTMWNHIRVDWLTGRARVERQEIQ